MTWKRNKEKTDSELLDIIMENRSVYVKPRTVYTILDMVKKVQTKAKL
jgi:hypothetical protein